MSEARKGVIAMIGACLIWGFAPILYKQLSHLPPAEILAHRTLWSFATFGAVLMGQGRLRELGRLFRAGSQTALLICAAVVISVNWFFFIFAIGIGHAIEASIGYYIYPLVAVLAGRVVFGESISRWQVAAVALAGLAVLVLTVGFGVAPWISLVLAVSFTSYGVLKRWISAGPVLSVTGETLVLAPLALGYLALWGQGGFSGSARDAVMLVLSGPLTATPLILFSYANKRAPMAHVGLTQYLNPTLQFLVAALVFAEPVTRWHAIALPMIWLALALYSWSAFRRPAPGAAPT